MRHTYSWDGVVYGVTTDQCDGFGWHDQCDCRGLGYMSEVCS